MRKHVCIISVVFLFVNIVFVGAIGTYEVDPNKLVGKITHVEGNDLKIVNSDRNRNVTYTPGERLVNIYEGGSVITGDNTFVEISLLNSRTLIKVAENTHFRLQHVEMQSGQSVFHVITGSIRSRIDKLSSKHQLNFIASNTVSGVRGTDFGITIVGPGGGAEDVSDDAAGDAQIYCFEGEVEVVPLEYLRPVPTETFERTVVAADEMVTVPGEGAPRVIEKTPVPASISEYWDAHPFMTRDMPGVRFGPASDRSKTPLLIAGGTALGLGVIAETVGIISLASLSSVQDAGAFTDQQTFGTVMAAGGWALLLGSAISFFLELVLGE
jgi:hypothetical protein